MPSKWASLPLFLLLSLSSTLASKLSFENTAVVRTVELGGSVVHVTTTYAIRSLEANAKTYTIALGAGDRATTSLVEARLKGQDQVLSVKERPGKDYSLFDVTLPKALGFNKTLNLVVETIQTHATKPWPESVGQTDDQSLKYSTDLFVLSPYETLVQRTKLRAISPRIASFTEPKHVDAFTTDAPVTKSGATVVYGPYKSIGPSTDSEFLKRYQQRVTLRYNHDQPVLEVLQLKRAVEISHWGSNLNTEDTLHLYNAGPKLKGHFSRLEHQTQAFMKRMPPHVLPALTLHLPAGIRNTYYYDLIGNVSTSQLRVAPSVPKGSQRVQYSTLDLRPRYPILGGWNYTFTLGYDAPLENSAGYDKNTEKYIVAVPIFTAIPGAVVNDEELTIILPEGATDVEFSTPFEPVETSTGIHETYLDTQGRPFIRFRYKNLTVKNAQEIYVTYKVSLAAHIRKAVAVATVVFGLFTFAAMARRVNLSLGSKSKVQ